MRTEIVTVVFASVLIGFVTHAQSACDQIAPNPNPAGNTLVNRSAVGCNESQSFDNQGSLINSNLLVNNGTLNNHGGLLNDSSMRNNGTLNNYGVFGNGGTLNNSGTLNNYSSMINGVAGGIDNSATLNNYGELKSGMYGFNNSGRLDNYGTLTIADIPGEGRNCPTASSFCGSLVNAVTGTLNNAGTLNNTGKLFNDGLINNSGQFVSSKFVLGTGTYTQSAGATRVDGSMTQAAVNIKGGVLQGTGSITGAVTVDGGRLAPGNSPGVLTIFGDYTQTMRGSFEAQIGGLHQGTEYDVLRVTGTATLAGVLDVSLFDLGGGVFTAHAGDTFDILSAETIIGSFNKLLFAPLDKSLRWEVSYLSDVSGTTDVVRLQVAAIPEPQVYAMLVAGMVVVCWTVRRKKRNQPTLV